MTNTTKPELLPCPFCGCERVSIAVDYPHVECADCGTEGPFKNASKAAVEAWNTRATQWQPIETVPDDAVVDLWIAHKTCASLRITDCIKFDGVWMLHDGVGRPRTPLNDVWTPTHWMPLLKAPEVE